MSYGAVSYGAAPFGAAVDDLDAPSFGDAEHVAEFHVTANAYLSLDIGVYTPADVTIRNIKQVRPQMQRAVFIDGFPWLPGTEITGAATVTATGTYHAPAAVETPFPPPTAATDHRWKASDLGSGDVTTWTSDNGLAFTGSGATRPTKVNRKLPAWGVDHPAVMFLTIDGDVLETTLSGTQPYTVVLVAEVSNESDEFTFLSHNGAGKAATVQRTASGTVTMNGGTALTKSFAGTRQLQVITAIFNGGSSRLRSRWADGTLELSGDAGSDGHDGFKLGGSTGSSRILFVSEVRYFDKALSDAEIDAIEQYAIATYDLLKYSGYP